MALSRISVVIPPIGPWQAQAEWYRWAEAVGYDVAYTYDHLTHRTATADQWLGEAFTTLTAAAACTERIRLGTLVASAVFRRPVALARVAMTVQDISGGRLILGIGLGAPDCERADRGAASELGVMADRFADVVHGYLAATGGATEWQGETMSFSGLQSAPTPEGVVPPELLIAAHGPRTLALAAAVADTWNTYGGPTSTQLDDEEFWNLLAAQAAQFSAQCAKAGRNRRRCAVPCCSATVGSVLRAVWARSWMPRRARKPWASTRWSSTRPHPLRDSAPTPSSTNTPSHACADAGSARGMVVAR